MTVYVDLLVLLNFAVDLLLILLSNRLCGFPNYWVRSLAAAAVGGLYGGFCVLPGFAFLGNMLWRGVFLLIVSAIAFGWNRSALRRGLVFVLLSMAMGGIALGMQSSGVFGLIASAAAVAVLSLTGLRGALKGERYVKVQLYHGDVCRQLLALRDTGNQLTDQVSGDPVIVVGPEVAWELLGLHREQLEDPILTMQTMQIPGLRLIPYRAVGQPGGMLLAIRPGRVLVNGQETSRLVAFSPGTIGAGEGFEALAGGEMG